MSETEDDALVAALWRVIAAHGWPGLTMARLSAESGLPAAALRARLTTRLDLLLLHMRWVDAAVLAGTVPNQGGAARDRLFDVLMRRLDTMQPHRAGMMRFLRDLRRDPGLLLLLGPHLQVSMRWMLDAADIEGEACGRQVLAFGLGGVWLATLKAWAEDESEDLGPTMAALDRALDRAEQLGRTLRVLPRPGRVPAEDSADLAEEPPPAEA